MSELAETEIMYRTEKLRFQFIRLLLYLLTRNTAPEANIKAKSAGQHSVNLGAASNEKTKYIQDLSDPFG